MSELQYSIALDEQKELSFKTADSVAQWASDQRTTWRNIIDQSPNPQHLKSHVENVLAQLANAATAVVNRPDDQRAIQDLKNALRSVSDRVSNNTFIVSESAIGKYISKLETVDPRLAGATLHAATTGKNQSIITTRETIAGVVALTTFDMGISKQGASSSRKLLSQLSTQYQEEIDKLSKQSMDRISELDDLILAREAAVKSSTANLARILGQKKSNIQKEQFELRTETKDSIDALVKQSSQRISDFEDFYETKIALLQPVSYWKKKRYWHRISTFLFAVLFLVYSASLVYFAKGFVAEFGEGYASFIAFWQDAGLGALGIVALVVGIALVLSRIIYRLFASQLHLWNDASERITMTETYLALAEKGHNKDEFMGALIDRLFAPASDGVVKDDFGSIGPLDAFAKRYGG